MKNLMRLIAAFGLVAAVAATSAAAQSSPPISKSAPTITGNPIAGSTLRAGNGLWYNSPTSFKYQWLRCDSHGNGCVQISGATSQTYKLTSSDVNHTIVVLVTASNSAGSSQPTNSKPTDVITPATAPVVDVAPSIVGKPYVGEQLVADTGEYSGGAVTRFGFQWQRCDQNGASCANIGGATTNTYKVVDADRSNTIRVQVTASNPYGSTRALSKPTAVITTPPAPVVLINTSIQASATTTICCQRVTLSGTTSPVKAGEKITILAKPVDELTANPIATATTDASGHWSAKVTPMIATQYTAATSNTKSSAVTILVHPRLGFGINGNNFSAKITARDSFGGAVAYFQMFTGTGWKTLALVVTNLQSTAKFHVSLKRGHTYLVRIYLPQRQAGPGYLDGVSHARRVGGTA
jgi:hypothetical protein